MFSKIIRNFIAKRVAGRSDDGIMISLKDPKKVDFQAAMMEDLLMRNGIDPRAITSEAELKMLLNQISKNEASRIRNTDVSGIRGVRSGDVVDMEGNKIPQGSRIMGGKAVDDLPPPGSRGGPDDIAAPVQSQEETLRNMTEAEIKANLEKQNKDSVQRILKRKNREDVYGLEDYDTTNMSEIKKEIIRTETKLGNLNPNTPGFRERAKPLIDKITALQKKLREDKADGGRIGFFMGSKFPKGLGALREMLQYYGKKSDAVKNPSDILKMVNPNKVKQMLEDPSIYSKFNVKEGIGAPETLRNIIKQKEADRIEMVEEMLGSARNIRKADEDAMKYKNDMIEDMMKKGIDRETAEGMAETITKMAEDAGLGKFKDTPKLTKEGVLELENILKNMKTGGKDKRSLNADGGRIGLKDGPKMTRRTFLKYLAGFASIPIIGKIVKPLKTVKGVKNVPIIKTSDVKGKPEWFDQLVNKVIIEGDDVSKKFATKDREIIHMKEIDDETVVKVTQDLDEDAIRVEYESPENMYGDPVGLQFKKGRADEGTKGTPPDEFQTTESIPVARADGPDDYAIEIDEGGGESISDLVSDVSKLKQYATGKKPTLKEIVQTKKRKDQARNISEGDYDAETDFVTNRQGEPIIDMEPDIDYASGGLARLGYQMGGDVAYDATNQDIYGSSAITVTPDTVMDQFGNQVQAEMGNNFNKPLIPQVTEQASKQEGIMNSSPVVSQSDGTSEVDMPIAGGNNNAGGILPVMPQDDSPTDMRYKDPGPGVEGKEGELKKIEYNDPLPTNQLMSGFEEYKKTNPPGTGTMALVPVTLPNGEQFTFRNGAEATAFAQYLQSIGQAPYQRRQDPGMLAKFASGGIARMLGE